MAEYIDREEVFGRYEEEQRRNGPWSFRELISSIPAADVAPVKRGKWIFKRTEYPLFICYECSVCGKMRVFVDGTPYTHNMYYCPECGAKMENADETE